MTPSSPCLLPISRKIAYKIRDIKQHSMMPQTSIGFNDALNQMDRSFRRNIGHHPKKQMFQSYSHLRSQFRHFFQCHAAHAFFIEQSLDKIAFLASPRDTKTSLMSSSLQSVVNKNGESCHLELLALFDKCHSDMSTLTTALQREAQQLKVLLLKQQTILKSVYGDDFEWLNQLKLAIDRLLHHIQLDEASNKKLFLELRQLIFDHSNVVTIDLE